MGWLFTWLRVYDSATTNGAKEFVICVRVTVLARNYLATNEFGTGIFH